jgi:HEAT repeat protein
MAQSKDAEERQEAANQLYHDFTILPDKNQAWDDLHRLTKDEKSFVRVSAASALGVAFSYVPDKNQVWDDLHRLTQDKDNFVRGGAAEALGAAFSYVPDKNQAWDDLHQLAQDENSNVRESAAEALGVMFSHVPDIKQAWNDLHNLTQDEDSGVREEAGYALVAVLSDVPDKNQVWDDMRRLTKDEDSDVIDSVIYAIGPAFLQMSDKNQAWDDLHQLAMDEYSGARVSVAVALGVAFPHVPDKNQAWNDLHRLTQDKDIFVRWHVADALGTAYSHIPDEHKKEACDDLIRLAWDKEGYVRTWAYFSLGKVSIFRGAGTEKEDDFKKDMEEAIQYFEKASQEKSYFNHAKFCLPFYRSFYTLTFKKEEAKAEIQKYLAEAKRAVEGSKSKEKLLEAVENLGNALKEAQKAKDFDAMKCDLNASRRYCERAADLLDDTEEKAPVATRLIRRGLPIIDQMIKEIIAEIQENAKTLCKQTKDTPLEDLGKEVIRVSQAFPQIRDPIGLEKGFINLWTALSSICAKMPEEERGEACELLKKAGDEPGIGT